MSGDTVYPGGVDTAYGAEADYLAGFWDDIDGAGTDISAWMRRVESASIAQQYYGARVKGIVTGTSYSTNASAHTVMASTITIPANFLRAGSILEVRSRGVVTLNSGTPTLNFKIILGGTTYDIGTTGTISLSSSPRQYHILISFTANTIGATADVHASGDWRLSGPTANGFDVNSTSCTGGETGTVDTTSAMTLDVQSTMSVSNAANAIVSGLTSVTHIPFIG